MNELNKEVILYKINSLKIFFFSSKTGNYYDLQNRFV